MADKSSIEWTDATWNPTRGCTKIAPGCAHCYAETFAERFRGVPGHPYEQGFDPREVPGHLTVPLKWKKGRRIFVDSMSDLFHESFSNEYIEACFGVMTLARQHTFQILTKRPDRALEWFRWFEQQSKGWSGPCPHANRAVHRLWKETDDDIDQYQVGDMVISDRPWPLPNVWIGTSIANQTDADKNVSQLLRIPAAVRFLSIEPLLGPVDLSQWIAPRDVWQAGHLRCCSLSYPEVRSNIVSGGCRCLHWVIVGGESGPGARPCNVEWIRSIVRQCAAAGVPCFVKQLGANVRDRNDCGFDGEESDHWPGDIVANDLVEHDPNGYREEYQGAPVRIHLGKKGGQPEFWPEDLRVRQFPEAR